MSFTSIDEGGSGGTIPSEVTEGTIYYIVSPTAGASFKVSATEGGGAIDFTSTYSGLGMNVAISDLDQATNEANSWDDILGSGDNTFHHARAAMYMGLAAGSSDVTSQMMADINTFANGNAVKAAWDFDEVS